MRSVAEMVTMAMGIPLLLRHWYASPRLTDHIAGQMRIEGNRRPSPRSRGLPRSAARRAEWAAAVGRTSARKRDRPPNERRSPKIQRFISLRFSICEIGLFSRHIVRRLTFPGYEIGPGTYS